jgi:hypothetical protein
VDARGAIGEAQQQLVSARVSIVISLIMIGLCR